LLLLWLPISPWTRIHRQMKPIPFAQILTSISSQSHRKWCHDGVEVNMMSW
jgi:hypothetical protein